MASEHKTIRFECDQELFDRILAASRASGDSLSDWIRKKLMASFSEAEARRAEYRRPRRFYTIDPD